MIRSLTILAILACAAWIAGTVSSPQTGWIILTAGLALIIIISGIQRAQIMRWVKDIESPPPVSVGPWDGVLAIVYRQVRKYRKEIDELNQSVSSIMLAAEALPDGAVTLDSEMNVTWCNQVASEHIGLDLSSDKGFSVLNILRNPEFAKYVNRRDWPEPILLHLTREGNDRALLLQLTPYGIDEFLLVTRDVTQMEKLETTRKDFVANVSHELRTPLTVLTGFLETLHDMPPESLSDEQREQYQILMMNEAKRMQAIVDDLLTLSTLESSPSLAGEPLRISGLIHHALTQAKALSRGQHIFVENINPDLGVIGIESELASAIGNLLNNAVSYTPKDGTITVSWYATESGTACYSVQDTGIGIASQDIPRLTERFYRVDRGRSRATGGTGLGLAITKHIAIRHHAELHIRSRLGAGSTFSLEFSPSRIAPPPAI